MNAPREDSFYSEAYRRMLTIRRFEETVYALYKNGEILGALHLSIGQEAAAVGACIALKRDDYVTGTHRCHGQLIAKGASLKGMMAELFGKRTGLAKGKGGHMHLVDISAGHLGSSGIVASNLPVAVGVAMALKQERRPNVCLVFFGDGAVQEGAWHESLNLATLWKLPVVFFCENNGWAQDTPQSKETLARHYSDRAAAYGLPAQTVDGQDFMQVLGAAEAAISSARQGKGPGFVEAMTYRFHPHSARPWIAERRPRDEVEAWLKRDPIDLFRQQLEGEFRIRPEQLTRIALQVEDDIAEAVAFARESPFPAIHEIFDDVYQNRVDIPWYFESAT